MENALVMIEACSFICQNLLLFFGISGILELCGLIHGDATHQRKDLWLQLCGIIKGNVENKYKDITLATLLCLKYHLKEVKILRQLPRKTILYLFLLHLLRLLQATLARLHLCLTYLQEGNYNHQTWWHWWANLQQEPAIQEVIHLWFDLQLLLPLSRILTSKLWKTDWKPPWPKSWKS